MVTWLDIKLKSMQKMFSADGNTIPTDASSRDYIAAMPGAANEALQLLSTAGKFIIKSINIAHNPVSNAITCGTHIKSMERGVMSFEAYGVRSIYFEYFGIGTCTIKVNDVVMENIDLESETGYSEKRILVSNPDDRKVELLISSDYPMAVKNVALYTANFPTADKIPTFAEKVRYDLKTLVDDFYMLTDEPIFYEGDADISRYKQTSDYFQESNTVLVLDRDTPGNFKVYYKAYPQRITSATTDDTILAIDDEVAELIPLYIASQLYKDDDNGIATAYRNEFEIGFSRLIDRVSAPSAERFTSESGWI